MKPNIQLSIKLKIPQFIRPLAIQLIRERGVVCVFSYSEARRDLESGRDEPGFNPVSLDSSNRKIFIETAFSPWSVRVKLD